MHRRLPVKKSLDDLGIQLERLSSRGSDWKKLWTTLIEHPWFQRRLRVVAIALLKSRNLPADRLEDLVQSAILELATSMQGQQGLNYDPDKGSLGGFLSVVARRCCRKSLRQFRPVLPPNFVLTSDEKAWASQQRQEELYQAIFELPEPAGTTARFHCAGWTIDEIARCLGHSRRSVFRHLQHARKLLRDELRSEVDPK